MSRIVKKIIINYDLEELKEKGLLDMGLIKHYNDVELRFLQLLITEKTYNKITAMQTIHTMSGFSPRYFKLKVDD